MQSDERAPKAVRVSLKALWREFRRRSYLYPPIYHELWIPGPLPEELAPKQWRISSGIWLRGVCKSFREANWELLGGEAPEWQIWDGAPDASHFGRFSGEPQGFEEFKSLAESAYLVLCEIDPALPEEGHTGWLRILHRMASDYPTPLLRSDWGQWIGPEWDAKFLKSGENWLTAKLRKLHQPEANEEVRPDATSETKSDAKAEHDTQTKPDAEPEGDLPDRWVQPKDGGDPYPERPEHYVLAHDVCVSSRAAIELILDRDRALLIGEYTDDFPVSFASPQKSKVRVIIEPHRAMERVTEPVETKAAEEQEQTFAGPVRKFHFDKVWHLEFDPGDGTNREEHQFPFPRARDGQFRDKGFRVYHLLLSRPMQWIAATDILIETGQIHSSVEIRGARKVSTSDLLKQSHDQDAIDIESARELSAECERLQQKLNQTLEPEERRLIEKEIQAVVDFQRKITNRWGRPRKLASDAERCRKRVQTQIIRARQQISAEMQNFADYLTTTVTSSLGGFRYDPEGRRLPKPTTAMPESGEHEDQDEYLASDE